MNYPTSAWKPKTMAKWRKMLKRPQTENKKSPGNSQMRHKPKSSSIF